MRRVLALVGGRAQPDVLLRVRHPTLPIMDFVCLAASLIDYSAPTVGPVAESSYEACELSLRRSQRAAMQFAGENPSRNYRSCASTPSGRRGHGDNVASMAWGARNLISTQVSRTDHPNYVAASRAVTKVFGKPPDLTREGGSIPVANWLADATGMNVLLLPTSASNDGAHAQNEKR